MAFYGTGNPPQTSTQVEVANPSTSDILAEVTGLGGESNRAGLLYEARVIIGASTIATYWVEQCKSTGLSTSALSTATGALGRRVFYATVNQSAQYMIRFNAITGDRLRVRLGTALTGNAAATLQVEPLA